MKRILFTLVLFVTTIAHSQEKIFEKEVAKISKKIELITKQQKDSLKAKVVSIDKQLANGEISDATAEALKKEVAAYHAKQIEKLVGEQESALQMLVQQRANGTIASEENEDDYQTFFIGSKEFRLVKNHKEEHKVDRKKKKKVAGVSPRTRSEFVFALGLNNVLLDHQLSSLNDSEYQFGRSRFYEVGFSWKHRLSKDPSIFHMRYGFSFLWNNLRPTNDRYHVLNGESTDIVDFPDDLDDARLRHVQLIFPLHFELDFSKPGAYRGGGRSYRRARSWRVGFGGFVGFKLGTRQYLEYSDSNRIDIEEVQFDNFNMNTFNYGLSAYVGHRATSFYVKYDLNPLFQDTEIRNLSMGLRFEFN